MGLIVIFVLLYCIVLLGLVIEKLYTKKRLEESVLSMLKKALIISIGVVVIIFILGLLSSIHDYLDFVGCRMY